MENVLDRLKKMIGLISWLIFLLLVVTKTHAQSEWYHILHHRHREIEDRQAKCLLNRCLNGGTCTAYRNGFRCTCKKGWIGDNCERRSICFPNPCFHGRCSSSIEGFTCTCQVGYKGELCDVIQHCHPNPCWNGGTCTESAYNIYCDCKPGFKGRFCEYETKCTPLNPCVNGGQCREMLDSYYCMCNEPYKGINCEMIRPTGTSEIIPPYMDGPQAIPSPAEYNNRAVSLADTGGIQSKGNQLIQSNKISDITLAKAIFSPTVFDPPPFGGVKDPDLNSLHKATPAMTPEIYNEINLEKQNAMLDASASSHKKEELLNTNTFTNTNTNTNPIQIQIHISRNSTTALPGTSNLPTERIEVPSSNVNHLKSQDVAEVNGTKRSLSDVISEKPLKINKFDGQKHLTNQSGDEIKKNDTDIRKNISLLKNNLHDTYIGCRVNEHPCATKTDRKKLPHVMPDLKSDVSLLRMRGNIVAFHKLLHKLPKNAIIKVVNKNNVVSDILRVKYRNGTGVSLLRTRGNVAHGRWSHNFLNNSAEIKNKNYKILRVGDLNVTVTLPNGEGLSNVNSTRENKATHRNKMNNISNTISEHKDEATNTTLKRQKEMPLNFTNVYNGTKVNRTFFSHSGSMHSGSYLIRARTKNQTFYYWPNKDLLMTSGTPIASMAHEVRFLPQNFIYGNAYKKLNYLPTDRNAPHTTVASSNRRFFYLPHIVPYATTKTSFDNDYFPPAQTLTYRITSTPQKRLFNSTKLLSYTNNQRRQQMKGNPFSIRNSTSLKMVVPRDSTELTKDNILDGQNECPHFCRAFCDPWCQRIGCCVASNDQLKTIQEFEKKYTPSKDMISVPKGKSCTKCHLYTDCVDGHCLCKKGFFGNGGKCWPLPIPVK